MTSTTPPRSNAPLPGNGSPGQPRRGSGWRLLGWAVLLIVLFVAAFGVGVVLHALKGKKGEAGGEQTLGQEIGDIGQIATNPESGFPGKSKVVICCMGIDDNWTNSDEVFTAGARTDTLFLLTLDFDTKKATMLSIPRDTYVPIAGTRYSDKINAAFSTGGPLRTDATIQQWLGATPDYYIVLNIDATKRMVAALGGVDLDVEHAMNYDDQWGHLHVHLTPGYQHLDADQAVGFARYRHGNHGVTPEDGDERRMYRQHVLLRAMIAKAKTFSNIVQANNLIDTAMSCIRTNLTRTQLADLAALFHNMNQETDVTTVSLSGQDSHLPNGAYIMTVDQKQAKLYARWLVDGDQGAGYAVTPVRIANGTSSPGLAKSASTALASAGFTDSVITTSAPTGPGAPTAIVDTGVADRGAVAAIEDLLKVPNATVKDEPVHPNRLGWTPPASLTVTLGADYKPGVAAQSASAAQ